MEERYDVGKSSFVAAVMKGETTQKRKRNETVEIGSRDMVGSLGIKVKKTD